MDPIKTALITVPTAIPMVALTGAQDAHLRIFEKTFPNISITVRGNEIFAGGDLAQLAKFEALVRELLVLLRAGQSLNSDAILRSIEMFNHEPVDHFAKYFEQSRKNYSPQDCESEAIC